MDELIDRIGSLREQLRQLEASLAQLPPTRSLAVLEVDAGGRIRALSASAALRLDPSPEELTGARLSEFIEGSDPDEAGPPLVMFSGGGVHCAALRIPSGDGELVVLGPAGSALPAAESGRAPRRLIHDLANILGIMRGHAELTAMQYDDEGIQSSMREILEAVQRARDLLEAQR